MPRRRIEMRKLKEVLRLRLTAGLSNRKIALVTGIGKTAVSRYVSRAKKLRLDWSRIVSMSEEAIEALLYPSLEEKKPGGPVTPDWDEVAKELRRKGVTKQLLWEAGSHAWVPRFQDLRRRSRLASAGGEFFEPLLLDVGVDEGDDDRLVICRHGFDGLKLELQLVMRSAFVASEDKRIRVNAQSDC